MPTDFVYGNTTLPDGKVDNQPLSVPSNKGITAAEWNTTLQAMKDLRNALLNGEYHSFQDFAAAVSDASKGSIRFSGGRFQVSENAGGYRGIRHPDVNVLDFGADPTGVADSSPAFMAAIASLSAINSSAGGTIIVPPGTFRLASTVRIKKSVHIKGSHFGPLGCTIQPDPGITAFKVERYNVSTDLGSGAGDLSQISNLLIYNASHKVGVWQQSHAYTVGQIKKVGPAPGQGAIPFTDINEYYRHYRCTTAGTSSASGPGPRSLGQDKVISHGSPSGGSVTLGNYFTGGTSGAQGKLIADISGAYRFTSVAGTFANAETLTEHDYTTGAPTGVTVPTTSVQSNASNDELDGTARWAYVGAGAGIHVRANSVNLTNIQIDGMSGSGVHVVGGDLEDPGAACNANQFCFVNLSISTCDGHGAYFRGSDTNDGVWLGGSLGGNGGPASDEDFSGPGFNLWETSFTGNTFVGIGVDVGAGQGSVYVRTAGGGPTFIGLTQEGGGGGPSIIATLATVIGGSFATVDFRSTGLATGSSVWNPSVARIVASTGDIGFSTIIRGLTAPAWRASTYIPVGIQRTNGGKIYVATTAGVTAGSGGPTGTGSGITDNTVVWNYVGVPALGDGYVQIGARDPNLKQISANQIPDDVGVALSWQEAYEGNAGPVKNARVQRYGTSGPNAGENDGDGIGQIIATNQSTVVNAGVESKIPAGRNAVPEVWVGGQRNATTPTAADPTYGIWNPGDRLLYKGAAISSGGPQGRRCVTGGTSRTSPVRTATATNSTVIVLSGGAMSSLRDQQVLRVGDYLTVGGSSLKRVVSVSADGLTATLDGTISGTSSGLALAFVPPVFEEFTALSPVAQTFAGDKQFSGQVGIGVTPGEKLHVLNGNLLFEAAAEAAIKFKRQGTVGSKTNPIFQFGRIIPAGIGLPEWRVLYSDDGETERIIWAQESSGTMAIIGDMQRRSKLEGYDRNGAVTPSFRLTTYPLATLELGPGDVAADLGQVTRSGTTVTVHTNAAHAFKTGDSIYPTPNGADASHLGTGPYTATVSDSTHFTYSDPTSGSYTTVAEMQFSAETDAKIRRVDQNALAFMLGVYGSESSKMILYSDSLTLQSGVDIVFKDATRQTTAATGSNSGDVTLAAVGSTPSANGASLSGQALTLQPADGTHPGQMTSGTQTLGGDKTFSGDVNAKGVKVTGHTGGKVGMSLPQGVALSLSGAALDSGDTAGNWAIVEDGSNLIFYYGAQPRLQLNTSSGQIACYVGGLAVNNGGKVLASGGLGVGNAVSASVIPVANLVKKMEVFDASGTSLGFVPIYSSIT